MHIVAIGGIDDFKHMVRMRKALADRVWSGSALFAHALK